jgi:hypothetical protein
MSLSNSNSCWPLVFWALAASIFQAALWAIEITLDLPHLIGVLLYPLYPAAVSFCLAYFQTRAKLVPLVTFVAVSYGALVFLSRTSSWDLSFGAAFFAFMTGSFAGGFVGVCRSNNRGT